MDGNAPNAIQLVMDIRGSVEMVVNWFEDRILPDGKLSDLNTTSEYERGFIDCWNEYVLHDLVKI